MSSGIFPLIFMNRLTGGVSLGCLLLAISVAEAQASLKMVGLKFKDLRGAFWKRSPLGLLA